MKRTAIVAVPLMLALLGAACSEEGEGPTSIPGDVTTPTAPEATDPPEAQPPETTQPPNTTQAPDTTEAPQDESNTTAIILVILGLIVAVAILVGVLIGQRSSSDDGDEGADPTK